MMHTRRITPRGRFVAGILAGLALWLSGTDPARAGFTVTLNSTSPSGSNTAFNYSASISSGDQINPGDFFRIYDFSGLVGTPTAPAGWTVSVQNSSPTPPPNVILVHGDDPAIPNLIFTYAGTSPILGGTTITGFQAVSTQSGGNLTTKDFVGRDTVASGSSGGTAVDSRGDVSVPAVAAVPEPTGLVSASLGVLAFGAAFGYRNRRKIHTAR
jgi:hypothetical protein